MRLGFFGTWGLGGRYLYRYMEMELYLAHRFLPFYALYKRIVTMIMTGNGR